MTSHGGNQSFIARLLFGRAGLDAIASRPEDILDQAGFREALRREMSRAERTRSLLTLLVFNLTGMGHESEAHRRGMDRLARVVAARSRKTDVKGWYEDAAGVRVGLILHHTQPEKARAVIRKVRAGFRVVAGREAVPPAPSPEIMCEIYAYPGEREPAAGGPDQLWLFDPEALANLQEISVEPSAGSDQEEGDAEESRDDSFLRVSAQA